MKLANKPKLRSVLKKLYVAPIDWTDNYTRSTAAQEAIDFMAMMAGLKPVYVTGRGFDHEGWVNTVTMLAEANRLHVCEGPFWQAVETGADLPEWYSASTRARLADGKAIYVTKARAAAEEVAALAETGKPSVAQEARLLGFPECCVAAHYETADAMEKASFEILRRRADGNEEEMRRLAEDDKPVLPMDDEDRELLAEALSVRPAAYTSLNMCKACAETPDSPGQSLSTTYRALVDALTGKPRR